MTINLNIPFDGFYESLYSSAIDQELEQWVEYEVEYRQAEENIPEHLHLDANELNDIFWRVTDYSIAYRLTAEKYVDAFNSLCGELFGFDPGMKFETMQSPREYNFATDRIFVDVPERTIRKLIAISAEDNHATFEATIRERFTSYDGFISHYPNSLARWREDPLSDWDHNQWGTLLIACMSLKGYDRTDLDLYYATTDRDGLYHEWSAAVDWPEFEKRVQELRDEKQQKWDIEHEGVDPLTLPYFCRDPAQMALPL